MDPGRDGRERGICWDAADVVGQVESCMMLALERVERALGTLSATSSLNLVLTSTTSSRLSAFTSLSIATQTQWLPTSLSSREAAATLTSHHDAD